MRYLFLLVLLFILCKPAFAQQFHVSESEIEIKGVPRKGQQILIQLDSREIEKAWDNHLREKAGKIIVPISFPKSPGAKGITVLEKVHIDTISKNPIRILSKVEASPEGTRVWWTLDLGNAYVSKDGTPEQFAAAEHFLQDFARKAYREDLKRQVEEAEKVLQQAQQEHSRVMRQADALKRDLERNAQRKQELEEELTRNAKELTRLTTEVENNLRQQEAARQEIENMKKAVEQVKARAAVRSL